MARESKFLKLYLPDRSDNYDVERDQNDNFLKLDAAAEQAQKMAKDLFSKKQDKTDIKLATNDKTVVGAINENQGYTDGLAGLQGENSFPLSQATEGQVYKEPNSKKYYVCTRNYNGDLISVPNGSFAELNTLTNNLSIQRNFSDEWRIRYKEISKGDLDLILDAGRYVSRKWANKFQNVPPLQEGNAFYLIVENTDRYPNQTLIGWHNQKYTRAVETYNGKFGPWKKIY